MMPSTPLGAAGQPVAGLRIAVIEPGPGVPAAAEASILAERLVQAGHQVQLVGWSSFSGSGGSASGAGAALLAHRLLDAAQPARAGVVHTLPVLSSLRPDLWARVARHLRHVDLVLLFPPRAAHLPGALGLVAALSSRTCDHEAAHAHHPRVVTVLPRQGSGSGGWLGRTLSTRLLSLADAALVPSEREGRVARAAGVEQVLVLAPPPDSGSDGPGRRGSAVNLLVLRPGDPDELDELSRAVQSVPSAALTILDPADVSRPGAHRATLRGVTRVRPTQLGPQLLGELLDQHDVLVLTDASTSADVALARSHGLPMVVPADVAGAVGLGGPGVSSEVVLVAPARSLGGDPLAAGAAGGPGGAEDSSGGSGSGDTRGDRPDGAVQVPPLDGHAGGRDGSRDGSRDGGRWTQALVDVAQRWGPEDWEMSPLSSEWANYVARIEVLAASAGLAGTAPVEPGSAEQAGPRRPTCRKDLLRSVGRRLRARTRPHPPVLDLAAADLPSGVLATDVLTDPGQVDHAREVAHEAGMPWSRDGAQAWAALGAVATVLRVCTDAAHAVIVDESGTRSVFTRWMRRLGYAPVVLDFTGESPSLGAMDIDAGSLDVVVRLHPNGCDAGTVRGVLERAGWALRPGGLLVITLPLGPVTARGCVSAADVRAMLAQADGEGLSLIGDLDGHLRTRMTEARDRARSDRDAFGLVRLAWRKR